MIEMTVPEQPRRWWHLQWFAGSDTKEERRSFSSWACCLFRMHSWPIGQSILTRRISVCIDGFIVHGYSRGYEADMNTTDNAYVSGLKEDPGFHGNELVKLQTMYTIGAVLGQLPFAYLFTKLPMSWVIPFMDVAWGIFTLVQYRATSFAELAAYRFLVGWFEVRTTLLLPLG